MIPPEDNTIRFSVSVPSNVSSLHSELKPIDNPPDKSQVLPQSESSSYAGSSVPKKHSPEVREGNVSVEAIG